MINAASAGPQTMAGPHYVPPPGRQHRPRRKSLEQLEAKYKALMRNMLMYQQMRKRTMGGGNGSGTSIKTEGAGAGGLAEKTQQHLIYQAQQTLPTPSSSVSPTSSITNLEDTNISKQNQAQQQATYQQQQQHHHQNPTPALREQQRERPPQKRLQNAGSGPKSAYDRREAGSSARHTRPPGRTMPAAMQLAYEELASIQRQQSPLPQQQQQQHHQPHHQQQLQFQPPNQQTQQQHQGSAPIPIPRPTNIQIPSHYLQQQYMHHVSPHMHAHHQSLTSPLPTPPHLTASYTAHHNLPTMSTPYASYDTGGMPTHMDQRQQQPQQHPHHHPHQPQHGMPAFGPNDTVDGDLLDCFVSNMGEM